MLTLIIIAIVISLITGYFFLVFKPSKNIQNFARTAETLGYKVKHIPYQPMTFSLIKYLRKDEKNLKIFKQQFKDYDLIVCNMFTSLTLVLANHQLVKDFFSQLSKYPKSPFLSESFQLLNGGGIVFSEGESWRKKRRTISNVFHFDFLNDLIPTINEQTQKEFAKIDKLISQGHNINILKSVMKILSSVIAKSFFGTDMEEYQIQGKPYFEYFNQYINDMISFNTSLEHFLFGMKLYRYGITGRSRSLKRRHHLLNEIAKEIVLKEIEKIKNGQSKQNNILRSLFQGGLLSLDLKESKPDQYNLYDLIGQFYAFFAAGTDTTAHSVNIALHYLSQNTSYQQKIREQFEELSQNLALNEAEKVKKLKWSEAVFSETLRLNGPIAYIIVRKSTQDTVIGKLSIPKGTQLTIMPILMHYKKENFDNPQSFKPQKWLEDKPSQPFSFIPFGGGQRNCLGQHLARIQAKIIISSILAKYQFKALNPIKMRAAFVYGNESQTFQMKPRRE